MIFQNFFFDKNRKNKFQNYFIFIAVTFLSVFSAGAQGLYERRVVVFDFGNRQGGGSRPDQKGIPQKSAQTSPRQKSE